MDNHEYVWSLQKVADDLRVDVDDVFTVAEVELLPEEYDNEAERVTERGRQLLELHFAGGSDPALGSDSE